MRASNLKKSGTCYYSLAILRCDTSAFSASTSAFSASTALARPGSSAVGVRGGRCGGRMQQGRDPVRRPGNPLLGSLAGLLGGIVWLGCGGRGWEARDWLRRRDRPRPAVRLLRRRLHDVAVRPREGPFRGAPRGSRDHRVALREHEVPCALQRAPRGYVAWTDNHRRCLAGGAAMGGRKAIALPRFAERMRPGQADIEARTFILEGE